LHFEGFGPPPPEAFLFVLLPWPDSPPSSIRIAPTPEDVVTQSGLREVREDFVKIVIVSSGGWATGALQGMLARLDSGCQVEVADDVSPRFSSPPAESSSPPDLVLVDVDTEVAPLV
jgi:hypothetical protein